MPTIYDDKYSNSIKYFLKIVENLGSKIGAATGTNPDDEFIDDDGNLVMSASNYKHDNDTHTEDLLEEIILRLEALDGLGGGSSGGTSFTPGKNLVFDGSTLNNEITSLIVKSIRVNQVDFSLTDDLTLKASGVAGWTDAEPGQATILELVADGKAWPVSALDGWELGRNVVIRNMGDAPIILICAEGMGGGGVPSSIYFSGNGPVYIPSKHFIECVALRDHSGKECWALKTYPNITAFDEMLGAPNLTLANFPFGLFSNVANGTGAGVSSSTNVGAIQKCAGIASLRTGTTAGGFSALSSSGNITGGNIYLTDRDCMFVARVAVSELIDGTDDYIVKVGFMQEFQDASANGLFWVYDSTAGTWDLHAQTPGMAGVRGSSSFNVNTAANDGYVYLGVQINAAGDQARFFISLNGYQWETSMIAITGLPETFHMGATIKKLGGTTNRQLLVDSALFNYSSIL